MKTLTIRSGRRGIDRTHSVYDGDDELIRFVHGQRGAWSRDDSLANARGWAAQLVERDPDFEGASITEAIS